ncbi:putative C6 transcription factor [Aspergillus clavatus NRRL 1]|uniref:C6 transcription factor, putative n=1 Tax=Aspergillus clavatus (strain ATCC 1007 / CBS 513.65 / DSM 816 / NCTC 3887 / NRRL 1 / QM 1276 / 107) TaxID=344612 RepID=A1CT74_ASPCL|nr:C6 transcription factor, putative [Aspergillus clavatus NRRL 1]EAW06511.1 C6 transcription factor, putative [Aspergillus clavatus NRRL 1]
MSPSPASGADESRGAQTSTRRTTRACDSCYKRKIKCDAAVPQCNWCSHHDIPCTFERVVRRRRKESTEARQHKSSRLAERISRIEKLLSENLLRESVPSLSPSSSELESPLPPPHPFQWSGSSAAALHFAGRELGVTSLITGIPFLLPEGREWIQARTGQRMTLDKPGYARPLWEKQSASNPNRHLANMQPHDLYNLPDRQIVECHLNIFRTTLMQRVFPIVDPVLFTETIDAAYSQPRAGLERADVRACLFSFLGFVSMLQVPEYKNRPLDLPPLDSEKLAVTAQCLIPQILRGDATMQGLEAVTIMALFELVTGNLRTANHYGSIAARLLYILGGHKFPPSPKFYPVSPAEQLEYRRKWHVRNLFWLSYSIEKDVSLRTGQPEVLNDENCDLTLPSGYVEQLYVSLGIHHHSQELPEAPMFPVDLRLSIIKSRAYSALYSFRALQKTDAEVLKEIRELDDELERWRISVPSEWRPTLSFSHETPDPNVSMHSVMLRLNYHLCMTIIHQASSRCKAWVEGHGGMIEGVSSSLALSVEASRSTLLYLQAAEHVLVDGVFWTLIFYPMSALISIFCNILQNPIDPQATKDLGLLQAATSIMERVFLRQLFSIDEVVHIKQVADFVTELYRLAVCAVEKAVKERDEMV